MLSDFDKGPWRVIHEAGGGIVVGSDDFTHDVWLRISGDFVDADQKTEYAESLVVVLNDSAHSGQAND